MAFTKVGIGGFTSEVGKSTLMCELLRAFSGWEAIKLTRGHYRSCGKDPHACCVSHLLSDEPVVRSGFRSTYATDKDTGRYWDAGASNVHWVIATDQQVEAGIAEALDRVKSQGVFIEGNSYLKYLEVDFAVMVARAEGGKIKPSARRALASVSALYVTGETGEDGSTPRERFAAWRETSADSRLTANLPVYTKEELPQLVARLSELVRVSPPDAGGVYGIA
jgi:hypothetical protein